MGKRLKVKLFGMNCIYFHNWTASISVQSLTCFIDKYITPPNNEWQWLAFSIHNQVSARYSCMLHEALQLAEAGGGRRSSPGSWLFMQTQSEAQRLRNIPEYKWSLTWFNRLLWRSFTNLPTITITESDCAHRSKFRLSPLWNMWQVLRMEQLR